MQPPENNRRHGGRQRGRQHWRDEWERDAKQREGFGEDWRGMHRPNPEHRHEHEHEHESWNHGEHNADRPGRGRGRDRDGNRGRGREGEFERANQRRRAWARKRGWDEADLWRWRGWFEAAQGGPGEAGYASRRDIRKLRRAYWRVWHARHHAQRRRFLFLRLLAVFGLLTVALLGGLFIFGSLLVFVRQIPFYIWLLILGLGIGLSFLAWNMAARAFRDFANPLTDLIEAAEAVAKGDLTVRVAERLPGDLGRLNQTFNRMLTELERADQQRRNLSADVAHELRTPIHILQGNIEGLLDGVYEPTAEHLNLLLDETRWLGRLVEDLRLLSLAEAGQLSLYKEPVAIADLLASVRQNFKGLAQSANLDWQVYSENNAVVAGDAGRLEQALGNLALNAIQHTPAGGKIRLWAEQDRDEVLLYVQDSGQGIAPEKLPYVFDRFWRGDAARTRSTGTGSGLGLAITRQLIESHGGTISVYSQPGEGTTFTIKLPLAHPN